MGARGKVMPWRDTTAGVEQERFILEWVKGGNSFSGLCRAFGISRKTGYKRVRRYQMWGLDGLGDLSRAPHSHSKKTGPEVEEKVIALRMANPTWGPKKLVAWLKEREAETGWPAPSTTTTRWGTSLERVYDSFQKHAIFAPSFGRKQWPQPERPVGAARYAVSPGGCLRPGDAALSVVR